MENGGQRHRGLAKEWVPRTLKIALIGEGQTEYHCLPKIAGRLGNVVVGRARTIPVSGDYDWERFFEKRVVPLVQAMAIKCPEKIVVVLDRERRLECPGDLARRGLNVIMHACGYCLNGCTVAVVISNRRFECILFADYSAVDKLPILDRPVSGGFPETTDENDVLDWIAPVVTEGCTYDKILHGGFLAHAMSPDSAAVQAHSRSLKKLVSELCPLGIANDV